MSDGSITLDTVDVAALANTRAITPYEKRRIDLRFALGGGHTFANGSSTLDLKGLRVQAVLTNEMLPSLPHAVLKIYGMTPNSMNLLTVAGLRYFQRQQQNGVQVIAGDAVSGMATVFKGVIMESSPDGQQPNMSFDVVASAAAQFSMPEATPTTFPIQASAEQIANTIAQKATAAGMTVKNNGVNVQLSNPYFAGSVLDQLKDLVEAAGCYGSYDSVSGILTILPRNRIPIATGGIPLISADTGMIGYPKFEAMGITVRTLFDPSLQFQNAQPFKVKVTSDDGGNNWEAANGNWVAYKQEYRLAAQDPDREAPWEIVIYGLPGDGPATSVVPPLT